MVQSRQETSTASAATSDIPLRHLAPIDPADPPAPRPRASSRPAPSPPASRACSGLQSRRSDESLPETVETNTGGQTVATCSRSRPFPLRTSYAVDFAACRDHLGTDRTPAEPLRFPSCTSYLARRYLVCCIRRHWWLRVHKWIVS